MKTPWERRHPCLLASRKRSKQAGMPALPGISRGKTMKVRRRRVTRRYRGAASPSPPPILPPPDLATEIEQSVEARDRLEALAAHAAAERDKSKPDFLRLFASEMRSIGTDSNNAVERLAAWQAQDARAAQRSD